MIFKIANASILATDLTPTDHVASWRTQNVAPSYVKAEEGEWNFEKRDGMLYVAVRAVSVGTNGNGDYFSEDELKKAYKTFIGKGVFVNHASNDVEKKRGLVVDARWVEKGDNEKYVVCLMEINESAFPELGRMMRSGQIDSVSMGLSIDEDVEPQFILLKDLSYKRYKDVRVGDEVVTHDGSIGPVVAIGTQHFNDLKSYKLKIAGNDKVVVSHDHKLLVLKNPLSTENEKFITVEDINRGDFLLTPIELKHILREPSSSFIYKNYVATPILDKEEFSFTGYGYNIQVGSDENLDYKANHSYILNNIVSSNCNVAYSNCSICNHRAATVAQYCLTGDSEVTLADGSLKQIKDIQIGDKIISAYGTIDTVKNTFKRHVEETIINLKVCGKKGTLKLTKEHPLLSYKKDWGCCSQCVTPKSCSHVDNYQNPEFIQANLLSVGDYILCPASIPSISNASPELAEFVGYYAAEGNTVKDKKGVKSIQFAIATKEMPTLGERILTLGKNLFGVQGRVYYRHNVASVRFHNRNIAVTMDFLCPGKARTKTVNSSIILSSPESQIAFLSAIIAGDGYYDAENNSIVYRSASKSLSNQVQQVAQNLGYFVTYYNNYQNRGPLNRESKCFFTQATVITKTTSLPTDELASFKLANLECVDPKQKSLFKIHENLAFKIIEKRYEHYHGDVYNIETEETESYLVHGLASHNCSHIKHHKGGAYNGRPVYEINKDLNFIELSIVATPADSQAKVLEILARQKGLDLQDLLRKSASGEELFDTPNSIEYIILQGIRRARQEKG